MSFSGIAGNHELIVGLVAELARRPSHAYMLAGPRGVGKALVATGLAHSILCERAPGAEFCCTPENCPTRITLASTRGRSAGSPPRCDCCAACVQIATGVHPDFIYVARNPVRVEVLIEQVRDLIQRLGLRPMRGERRVAIIDDAETLNLPGQNALLKTLEEPPGHTILFLVTDSEHILLDTVRSRLRPVRFGPLDVPEIESILKSRAELPPERAQALSQLARGSVSRALALADGAEPPVRELIEALSKARSLDFASIQAIAQDLFGSREAAAENFELIARLLEEMICFRLLGAEFNAPSAETARTMSDIAQKLDPATMAKLVGTALRAADAIQAMANSRLQAEQWWMAAAETLRGE
jgi:DNA polymerase III subunit delta'